MPELRHDPLREHWVIVAEEREGRPRDLFTTTTPGPAGPCPFCPGNERLTPPETHAVREAGEADGPGWRVRVVPNKYPALLSSDDPRRRDGSVVLSGGALPAIGGHEVVIETPGHEGDIDAAGPGAVAGLLRVYRGRVRHWAAQSGIQSVVVFKNFGERAGATLAHPHSQIAALPLVPPAILRERTRARELGARRGACAYCEAGREAARAGRLADRVPGAIAFVPFAPRAPYELWILPEAHEPAFPEAAGAGLDAVAGILTRALGRLRAAAGTADYNAFLVTALSADADREHDHWRLELLPKTAHVAGFELGSGMFLCTVAPERAAARLAAAAPSEPGRER